MPEFTGLAPVWLQKVPGVLHTNDGLIALSDPCDLTVLRWNWFGGQEDKNFSLNSYRNWIWLCQRDRRELHHFYGKDSQAPFFRLDPDNSGFLDLCWPDISPPIPQVNRTQTLLVPVRPFNEYSTTHFGHFVIELLPLMLVAQRLRIPVLTSLSLPVWALQLLQTAGLSSLVGWIRSMDSFALSSHRLPRATIQSAGIRSRLIRLQPSLAAGLLTNLSKRPERFLQSRQSGDIKVAVLSRQKHPDHRRWINESELHNSPTRHDYVQLFPEELGVIGLHQRLLDIRTDVVLAAIGSAAYQLFLNPESSHRVLLLCGRFDLSSPSRWFSTYEPFRARFWFLCEEMNGQHDWNEAFRHAPADIDRAVSLLTDRPFLETPVRVGPAACLVPPGCPLPSMPSFGVDFG
ncbi:glycosyltransferase 61 family protein [Synechococcus sp. KORDI-100]|uniref:glycosyltransferase 61 family protein n=1 Tax=Synechococcus sp. KORDI-100 TaxID=1280380 RepID=UPI0012E0BABF|nr:glycosyltransferase 61 family protein [Synechococcus sp. KORDI-100]